MRVVLIVVEVAGMENLEQIPDLATTEASLVNLHVDFLDAAQVGVLEQVKLATLDIARN